MPKGPLVEAHGLVVPIAHASGRCEMDAAGRAEMDATADGLAAKFRDRLNGSHTVAFERVAETKKGVYHVHRQVIPVPAARGDAASLLRTFSGGAERCGHALAAVDPPAAFDPPPDARFFVVDVYDGATGEKKRLALEQARESTDKFCSLHFGRDLLANALGAPHRAHWKACELPKHEEAALCAKFKALIE